MALVPFLPTSFPRKPTRMSHARVRPFPSRRVPVLPPTTIRAARRQLQHQLRSLISLLKRCGAKDLNWEATGLPLTPEEDRDWRVAANQELLDLARAADHLQLWIRARALLPGPAPDPNEVKALALLRPCAQALDDLYAKGFPFAPDVVVALQAAQRRLGGRPPARLDADSFLDELLTCGRDSPREEVFALSWIARGLKDASFLALLLERWQASFGVLATTGADRATRADLVEALVAFGREEEARALIEGIDGDDGSVAYLWLAFGAARPDAAALIRAQEIGVRTFRGKPLATFLLQLHRLGQGRRFLEAAGRITAELLAAPMGKPGAADRLLLGLLRGWLMEGAVTEARSLLDRLEQGTPLWVEGLALLYAHTGRVEDRDALLAGLAGLDPTLLTPSLAGQALRALLAQRALDEAVRLIEGWSGPLFRCLGFSTLVLGGSAPAADGAEDPSQRSWLDQAEAAYWSVDFRVPRHGVTLAAFVRACLRGWRVDRALAATGCAVSTHLRLRLLAAIYIHAEGHPEPPFVADWAERL